MPPESEIRVALGWDGRRVRRVAVQSRVAFAPRTLLAGRDPRDAAAILPRLYSVCAEAQGAAAAVARIRARAGQLGADPVVGDGPAEHAAVPAGRARLVVVEAGWRRSGRRVGAISPARRT